MPARLLILLISTFAIIWSIQVQAVEIDKPINLAFVADKNAALIDVIDLRKGKVVYTIEAEFPADQLVVSPYTPVLLYTNNELKSAVFYDLSSKQTTTRFELPITPRHLVIDTTGLKAAATDPVDGGLVLFSLTAKNLLMSSSDFPATGDVLFDPNDVDVYFSNSASGSLGVLNINTQNFTELSLTETPGQTLSSPSRSLDGRQIYVANQTKGLVYNINAFSKVIFKTFETGSSPARPYTTPQGSFLYLMDQQSGRTVTIEQGVFNEFADTLFGHGVNAVAVGRFDRFNLFMSTDNPNYSIYDNLEKSTVGEGAFNGQPLAVLGSADGRTAWVVFSDIAEVAMVNLENQAIRYFPATRNGAGAFTLGLSNNVCH